MFDDTLKVFKELNKKDFRILTGIEIEMKELGMGSRPRTSEIYGTSHGKIGFPPGAAAP